MKPASLLPRGHEPGPITGRPLRVQVSDAVTCVIARQGLVAENFLTAVEDETLELDVYGGEHRTGWLARDNPFLTDSQLSKLDERGVIRPGTVLGLDDIVASVLDTELPKRGACHVQTWSGSGMIRGRRRPTGAAPPSWSARSLAVANSGPPCRGMLLAGTGSVDLVADGPSMSASALECPALPSRRP